MTIKSKRVRTELIQGEVHDILAATGGWFNSDAVWISQGDVTVIGCSMLIEAHWTGAPGAGKLGETKAELSRVGKPNQPGVIMRYGTLVDNWAVGMTSWGFKTRDMFFPEGYGIDVDEGEALHLNVYILTDEDTSPNWRGFAEAIIFYVER